jgi:hypothetical protein
LNAVKAKAAAPERSVGGRTSDCAKSYGSASQISKRENFFKCNRAILKQSFFPRRPPSAREKLNR